MIAMCAVGRRKARGARLGKRERTAFQGSLLQLYLKNGECHCLKTLSFVCLLEPLLNYLNAPAKPTIHFCLPWKHSSYEIIAQEMFQSATGEMVPF